MNLHAVASTFQIINKDETEKGGKWAENEKILPYFETYFTFELPRELEKPGHFINLIWHAPTVKCTEMQNLAVAATDAKVEGTTQSLCTVE